MKKLALSLILACLSVSAAFAQNATEAGVSTSASAPAPELPSVQDVAAVAHKAGALVGGLFQGTFQVGAALFSGLKTGVTGVPSADIKVEPMQAVRDTPSQTYSQGIFGASVRSTPAPVVDRSVYSVSMAQ